GQPARQSTVLVLRYRPARPAALLRTAPRGRFFPAGAHRVQERHRGVSRLTGKTTKRPGTLASPGPLSVVIGELLPDSPVLLGDLGDPAGADGTTALANGEAQALLHGDRLDQRHRHLGVVARHDHLGALGEGHDAGHVGRPEVELRTVVVEERRVPAALVLGQDVDLALELGVRGVGARLDHDLAALHLLALDAAQQPAHVVAGLAVVKDLAE